LRDASCYPFDPSLVFAAADALAPRTRFIVLVLGYVLLGIIGWGIVRITPLHGALAGDVTAGASSAAANALAANVKIAGASVTIASILAAFIMHLLLADKPCMDAMALAPVLTWIFSMIPCGVPLDTLHDSDSAEEDRLKNQVIAVKRCRVQIDNCNLAALAGSRVSANDLLERLFTKLRKASLAGVEQRRREQEPEITAASAWWCGKYMSCRCLLNSQLLEM